MANEVQDDKPVLTGMARRLANLKPGGHCWPKGVSGNPSGLSKNGLITAAYNRILAMEVPESMCVGKYEVLKGSGVTFADLLALNTSIKAIYLEQKPSISLAAAKEITDRTEGRVPLRIAGADGGALEIVNLSEEERHARLVELTQGEVIDAEFEELQSVPQSVPQLPETTE